VFTEKIHFNVRGMFYAAGKKAEKGRTRVLSEEARAAQLPGFEVRIIEGCKAARVRRIQGRDDARSGA